MTLQRRLSQLEQRAQRDGERCPDCGYPEQAVQIAIQTDPDQPWPTCDACGRRLTANGRPLHDGPAVVIGVGYKHGEGRGAP